MSYKHRCNPLVLECTNLTFRVVNSRNYVSPDFQWIRSMPRCAELRSGIRPGDGREKPQPEGSFLDGNRNEDIWFPQKVGRGSLPPTREAGLHRGLWRQSFKIADSTERWAILPRRPIFGSRRKRSY